MVRSSPGSPGLAWRGAWFLDVLKCALPKPPLPPFAIVTVCPTSVRSASKRLAVLLIDLRAGRDLHEHVLAVRAVAVLAHAGPAVLCREVLLVAIVDQRVQPRDRGHHDVAAVPAVAAVRPAELDELLAAERDAAVPAVAGADVHLGFIKKFHVR